MIPCANVTDKQSDEHTNNSLMIREIERNEKRKTKGEKERDIIISHINIVTAIVENCQRLSAIQEPTSVYNHMNILNFFTLFLHNNVRMIEYNVNCKIEDTIIYDTLLLIGLPQLPCISIV